MRSPKNNILFLSSAGMIISCYYACSSFIMAAIAHKPIPMGQVVFILFLAAITTYVHNQRGWRRIHIIGLHTLVFALVFLQLCHSYYKVEMPLWRITWISHFFMFERTIAEGFILVLLCLLIGILWYWGIRLCHRPINATTISRRFDAGLGFLLLLLLIKLIITCLSRSRSPHTALVGHP